MIVSDSRGSTAVEYTTCSFSRREFVDKPPKCNITERECLYGVTTNQVPKFCPILQGVTINFEIVEID